VAFLPPIDEPPAPPGPQTSTPSGPPGPVRVLGLRARQWMLVAIALGCAYVVLTATSMVGAWSSLHRDPTNAELKRAALAEVAGRWRTWEASRIFPERLSYDTARGRSEFASRVGIVPSTSCEAAVDPEIAAILQAQGCRAVLRATYTDPIQGIVITVGVVAFPDAFAADRAGRKIPVGPGDRSHGLRPALRPAAFPGTAAARFTDAARQDRTAARGGPYVVLTTSGQSDGRPAAAITKERPGVPFVAAGQLGLEIARTLSAQAMPDCSSREWRC
jgi:hypothetical protein